MKRQGTVDREDERKRIKTEEIEAFKELLELTRAERSPHDVCSKCSQRFASETRLRTHEATCQSATTAAVTEPHPPATTPFETPDTTEIGESQGCVLCMGHGLLLFRPQASLDATVRAILEEMYQKGVTNSSNRKGVLEMVEECSNRLPFPM